MVDLTVRGQCDEAMRLLHEGKPSEATAICRRVLQAFPRCVTVYTLLGQAFMQLGKHEDAANFFRRVLGVDPEQALCYASLGLIYEERGLYDEALWQLQRALELSPGNAQIRSEVAAVAASTSSQPPPIRMTRAALARTYLRGQLYAKAIGELRELLSEQPERYDLRVALAEALWNDRQYADAELACQEILAALPNCLKAILILGQAWLRSDKDEQARTLLQQAQALDPENRMAQALFGPHSVLPLRVARLPMTDDDAPPIDLPYLSADDQEDAVESDIVARGMVVEGAVAPPVATPPDEATSPEPPAGAPAKPVERDGLSLWDVEYSYIADHPGDHVARLDLARKLYSVGSIDRALEQYGILAQGDYEILPTVLRDLDLLVHLYPDSPRLEALLAAARERARGEPST